VVDALQTVDQHGVACPANWTVGQEVIVPPPTTTDAAKTRVESKEFAVTDWYFSKKKL
jgi:peroxiredoxin (alkyl hydroperoxide reductase subunit C)